MKFSKQVVLSLALVLGTVAAALTLGVTEGFADPSPDQMHIKKLTYGGTGCPAGSVAVDIASDATAFTLIFDQFLAQIGPGVPAIESRKNCQVNLLLHVPHGFTYAITSVDYRGYANLAPGAQGMQKASYYFQGQAPTASAETIFRGPYEQDWQLRDRVSTAALVWSPCGVERSMNVNAQLRLTRGTAPASSSSFIQMDSEDGNIQQVYHIVWAHCPSHP